MGYNGGALQLPVPLQLPMLQKSYIHLQDAHQGRPDPSHQEDTALWCRQHLRAGKAMMPCSPSACPLTRHGNPCVSPQHFPSLAGRKTMPHMSRAQCKVQWWDTRAEGAHVHEGFHSSTCAFSFAPPESRQRDWGHSLMVGAD